LYAFRVYVGDVRVGQSALLTKAKELALAEIKKKWPKATIKEFEKSVKVSTSTDSFLLNIMSTTREDDIYLYVDENLDEIVRIEKERL
jgi:hypothetical protein